MRFLYSHTEPEKGLSNVVIAHRGKLYEGHSKLHPDDAWSKFTGCRFAEQRAEIKALKKEYQEKKYKCEECRKFVIAVQQYSKFNSEDPSAKAMFRQLNRRIREVNQLAEEISKREFNLQVAIRQQDSFNKKITKND